MSDANRAEIVRVYELPQRTVPYMVANICRTPKWLQLASLQRETKNTNKLINTLPNISHKLSSSCQNRKPTDIKTDPIY